MAELRSTGSNIRERWAESMIEIDKKTWRKIRKDSRKTKTGIYRIKPEKEEIKCPIKMDVDHDSPETIKEKWEQIKQWYKDNPEANTPWKEWEENQRKMNEWFSSSFLTLKPKKAEEENSNAQ